ncbi:MAG TPA: hypothetical protein PLR38_06205 [Syntrophorhabdaceae bacterium]|nr:hypothetical protein [Syntrophorhabdaceae bacterium]HOL05402.1 hypothetical protein [Syntrophorhabdaceae bacterium]HPP41939.1 hypothetical protein [Syntrophorhabdaceae bacterium]
MNNRGRAGCGCLLILLVIFMVFIGISIHPFTLRIIGKQFRYEDKVFKSDVIFVPRFNEDKNGEIYIDAFREYWAGNGNIISIEEDSIMGISMHEIVTRMAKTRGIKAEAIIRLDTKGDAGEKSERIKDAFIKSGAKKVIIMVPEYASRRFHLLYGSSRDKAGIVFIIKPVSVSYFKMDRWWRDSGSRVILFREVCSLCSYYFNRFKYGDNKKG